MMTQHNCVVLTIYDHEPRYDEMREWLERRLPLALVVDSDTKKVIGFHAVFPRDDDPILVAFREEFGS